MANQIENKKPNLVLGRVTDKLNRPLANLIVQPGSILCTINNIGTTTKHD